MSLLAILVILIAVRKPVMAEEEESPLPFWDPERYGVFGKYEPWTLSGGVGVRASQSMQRAKGGGEQSLQHQWFSQLMAGKGATGYIMEPYIARWRTDFMAGLTVSQSAESRQESQTSGSDSKGEDRKVSLTGQTLKSNAELHLFPESNFPFHGYFHRDNAANTATNADALGRLSQKFGFSQGYRDREEQMNLKLVAERRMDSSGDKNSGGLLPLVLPSIKSIDDARTTDTVTLRFDKQLDIHNVDIMGRMVRQDGRTRLGKGLIWERSVVVNHSFAPIEELSINNMANMARNRDFKRNYDDEALGIYRETDEFQYTRLQQISTNAYWRSQESPLLLNASLRAFQESNSNANADRFYSRLSNGTLTALGLTGPDGVPVDPNNTQLSSRTVNGALQTRSVAGRFGAGYRFDEHHSLSGALTANQDLREITQENAITESEVQRISETAGYQYDSGTIPWEEFSYSWYAGTNASNHSVTGQSSVQQLSQRVGHGLERAFPFEGENPSTLRLTLEESTGISRAFVVEADLTHAIGLGYEFSPEGGRAAVDLRLTDARMMTSPIEETQLFNLQFMRGTASDESESWSGNLSLNWLRHIDRNGLLTTAQTASGSLRYTDTSILGVPRLRYDMITTITGDSWAMGFQGPSEQEISWRNLLSYSIGKINLRAGGELKYLQNVQGEKNYQALLTFEVVRNFYRRIE